MCSFILPRSGAALAARKQKSTPTCRSGNFKPPPRKAAGFCCAKPKKKPPSRATISVLVPIWCECTTKFEPILSKMAKAQPRRLAGKSARCAPPEKPLCIFFEISPAEIFWDLEKSFLIVRFGIMAKSVGYIWTRK